MEELFDLGDELTLEDVEGLTIADSDSDSSNEQESPDLFDNKFSISFYGLIPNTILREDSDVLCMLIQISLESTEARRKITSLIRMMDIFVNHMERKITSANIPSNVDIITMNSIYDTFYKKLTDMKNAAKSVNFDLNLNHDEEMEDFYTGNVTTLTNYDKVKGVIDYIISTDKFDTMPGTSVAISMADEYKQLIISTARTKEIIDSFSRLKELTSNSMNKRSSTVETLIKLMQFSSKSYFFTDVELTAMEYLGFPYQVAGYERYFKTSPIKALTDMASGLKKSKSKVQEAYKQHNIRKEALLEKYGLIFSRKKYLCKENEKAGVNSSCIYF